MIHKTQITNQNTFAAEEIPHFTATSWDEIEFSEPQLELGLFITSSPTDSSESSALVSSGCTPLVFFSCSFSLSVRIGEIICFKI
jgi:hypothetical protein